MCCKWFVRVYGWLFGLHTYNSLWWICVSTLPLALTTPRILSTLVRAQYLGWAAKGFPA